MFSCMRMNWHRKPGSRKFEVIFMGGPAQLQKQISPKIRRRMRFHDAAISVLIVGTFGFAALLENMLPPKSNFRATCGDDVVMLEPISIDETARKEQESRLASFKDSCAKKICERKNPANEPVNCQPFTHHSELEAVEKNTEIESRKNTGLLIILAGLLGALVFLRLGRKKAKPPETLESTPPKI